MCRCAANWWITWSLNQSISLYFKIWMCRVFVFETTEHEWRWCFQHWRWLRRRRSIRAWRSSTLWWQCGIPADNAISNARLPQCPLHLWECFASSLPFCSLGSFNRCLPITVVWYANWTGARLLVGAIRFGNGTVFAHHVPAGHPHGHHHAPSGVCRPRQSLGSASQTSKWIFVLFKDKIFTFILICWFNLCPGDGARFAVARLRQYNV